MKYKALIFDIDGTAMQTERDALPSHEVIQAIKQAQKCIFVSAATGRSIGPARNLLKILELKDVIAHFAGSWTKNRIDIHVTHRLATKKQALDKLIQMLGVAKEQVIAVGDTGNDLPLFESAGFKVAMGNATDDLKKIADYIATSVNDDGLAYVINKFILK